MSSTNQNMSSTNQIVNHYNSSSFGSPNETKSWEDYEDDYSIILKYVETWIDDEEQLNFFFCPLLETHDAGIKDEDLSILLEDIKKYISESEKSDDDE